MVLWGTLVNAVAILLGTFLGMTLKFKTEIRTTIMQGLGLATIIIGIKMGLAHQNILIPIASLVIGGFLGESLKIDARLADLGNLIARKQDNNGETSQFTQGFVTTTLVYCIGAMAVIGALEGGLQGSHDTLYAKSMLDGVSAIFFASSFGIGVGFSAVAVFLYQGIIALFANLLEPLFHASAIAEMTATGGMLIVGISLNILGITKISVGNLLPSLLIAVLLSMVF